MLDLYGSLIYDPAGGDLFITGGGNTKAQDNVNLDNVGEHDSP